MKFFYGNFTSEESEFELTRMGRNFILGDTGRPSRIRLDWGLRGKIVRQLGQSYVFARLTQIQSAFQQTFQSNAGFLDSNNNPIPGWQINWSDTLGGVQITSPVSHDRVYGAMGLTYLYFDCALTAELPAPAGIQRIEETVTFDDIGGQPLTIERVSLDGDLYIQKISAKSFYFARQIGRIATNYPNPAKQQPYWPENLRGRMGTREDGYLPTKWLRGSPIEWSRSWHYEFISDQPFQWPQLQPVG